MPTLQFSSTIDAFPPNHNAINQQTMDTVLGVTELLEAILLQLDMTSLLVSASRVNSTWHHLIQTSPAIQQALFFRPMISGRSADANDARPPPSEDLVMNPLLVRKFGKYFFDTGEDDCRIYRCDTLYNLPWGHDRDQATQKLNYESFTRKGASWRRMLVSQPPPMQLGALWQEVGTVPEDESVQEASSALIEPQLSRDSPGLCMGDLYDLVQYHSGHHALWSFWYRVVWNTARSPYYTSFLEAQCKDLLTRTPLVVELYDVDDMVFVGHTRQPSSTEEWDALLRCESFHRADIDWTKTSRREFEFPKWYFWTEKDQRDQKEIAASYLG
ncbi:F-box domain-containing protein [Xylariomycetidae sp. FL2044]|nr:F-box domain-containing protein [Xylariomycetidae sp. FL2044]